MLIWIYFFDASWGKVATGGKDHIRMERRAQVFNSKSGQAHCDGRGHVSLPYVHVPRKGLHLTVAVRATILVFTLSSSIIEVYCNLSY